MHDTPVLILPGLGSSGPAHWQSLWQKRFPAYTRVEQADWWHPCVKEWTFSISRAVAACDSPPWLVAHSLATIAVAHWALDASLPVMGAFLVAPADVEAPGDEAEPLRSFAPLPRRCLPFASLVVGSLNDPYCTEERARALAKDWGADYRVAGSLGHINADSGLGVWEQGLEWFFAWKESVQSSRK